MLNACIPQGYLEGNSVFIEVRDDSKNKLNENKSKVYATILVGNNTKDSIIKITGISERNTYLCISTLKELDLIKRIDTNRTSHWEVTRKP